MIVCRAVLREPLEEMDGSVGFLQQLVLEHKPALLDHVKGNAAFLAQLAHRAMPPDVVLESLVEKAVQKHLQQEVGTAIGSVLSCWDMPYGFHASLAMDMP